MPNLTFKMGHLSTPNFKQTQVLEGFALSLILFLKKPIFREHIFCAVSSKALMLANKIREFCYSFD